MKALESLIEEDKIGFERAVLRNEANIIVGNGVVNDKLLRSLVISEDVGANESYRNDTTYTETFDAMYKAPELEIKNSISTT